jgi:thiol-disulfide isomerase/thioredoxin
MIEAINNKMNSTKKLKILNFYSDWCPPCHTFMPNFLAAEQTYWEYFDFIVVNVVKNMQLAWVFWVRSTPTIIILDGDLVVYNQSWVPNWADLKKVMLTLTS